MIFFTWRYLLPKNRVNLYNFDASTQKCGAWLRFLEFWECAISVEGPKINLKSLCIQQFSTFDIIVPRYNWHHRHHGTTSVGFCGLLSGRRCWWWHHTGPRHLQCQSTWHQHTKILSTQNTTTTEYCTLFSQWVVVDSLKYSDALALVMIQCW